MCNAFFLVDLEIVDIVKRSVFWWRNALKCFFCGETEDLLLERFEKVLRENCVEK